MTQSILVVAPHPDDEVLGVGGTIARMTAEGARVTVAIATRGFPPHFDEAFIQQGRREARAAHALLGVAETRFLDLPAAEIDTLAHRDVNAAIGRVFQDVRPDTVFIPFSGDIHLDHQHIFLSSLVASRPSSPGFPRRVLAYETLSETNWNAPYLTPAFVPNVFIDISAHVERKIDAMRAYASQIKAPPHERSAETLRALALLRGATVGCEAAEAFVLIRQLL
jgi:LmbE family N-acetylglucosaminyl deacetylase